MARITAEADYRELALKAIQPLQVVLRECGQEAASIMGIGGAIGIGSVVYAMTRISQLLGEPSLLEDAQHAACLITAEAIAGDTALDVIAGSAGTILGLLALYEVAPSQAILDRAAMCGQHLLRVRTPSAGGYRTWSTLQGKPATGFSHGAAGIIYALLRLYATTQDREIFAAACEGIVWENSLFSPEAGNWADVQGDASPIFMTTWCHGAPGIALARIGGLAMLDTPQIRADIEVALYKTQQAAIQGPDHLCCGNLGRAEILLTASQRLARPELAHMAREKAALVVTKAEKRGSFVLNALLPQRLYNPCFFQGLAGIGYGLLRLTYPDVLPSVLLWE
jgi:type 2 lantibiotic biosynthesis protein LanM